MVYQDQYCLVGYILPPSPITYIGLHCGYRIISSLQGSVRNQGQELTMPPHDILPYNIEQLLQGTSPATDSDVNNNPQPDTHNQSYTYGDDQSDGGKFVNSPYARKYERRNKSPVPDDVRLRVNSRERERMHDLTAALDDLRHVMPPSLGTDGKKPSKMSTLMMARNYIVLLSKSLHEMRHLAVELSTKHTGYSNIQQTTAYINTHGVTPVPIRHGYAHVPDISTRMASDLQKHIASCAPVQSTTAQGISPVAHCSRVDNGSAININIPCPCNLCH